VTADDHQVGPLGNRSLHDRLSRIAFPDEHVRSDACLPGAFEDAAGGGLTLRSDLVDADEQSAPREAESARVDDVDNEQRCTPFLGQCQRSRLRSRGGGPEVRSQEDPAQLHDRPRVGS
jgi:hypothetical protein